MNIQDLEYVLAAAAAGNLSGAARSLGVSTSTISRRVSRMEDELGLAIFERGHRGVRLTTGGRAVLLHARRAAAEFEAIRHAGKRNGTGLVGEVRLGLRMAPISEPMLDLLAGWRQSCADVLLTISEMNERDLAIALDERRVDAALAPAWMVSNRAAALPVYYERLFAALPAQHALAGLEWLIWPALAEETILVQGWDESQAERDFLAPLIGSEADLRSHAASKLSILALVAVGFGVTIVPQSQAEAGFPGVAFRAIDGRDALLQVDLAWMPEAEEPALGRFIAFMRDAARSRGLVRSGSRPTELREPAIGLHEAGQHGADQLRRLDPGLAGLAAEGLGIGDEIAMERRRQLDRQPDGLVVEDRPELQLRHRRPLSRDRVRGPSRG
jgi:DNA-binding transcriptional LysR family regulator